MRATERISWAIWNGNDSVTLLWRGDIARAGGKGANLASLARAGFDVPPGFILTTDAYRTFLEANEIATRISHLTDDLPAEDPAELAGVSAQIRAMFVRASVPAEIVQVIRAAYAGLPAAGEEPCPVAVRSSATTEDLPGLSFAGQQDTYLNVIGQDALVEAIKSCWASLWAARAMDYRARNRVATHDLALAVVVQQMVPAEVSGVLFTANPLTGHRGETVIDASFGLGEAIVAGQVEPDHYVICRRTMEIESRKLGAKALIVLPKREGGTASSASAGGAQQALADARILDLTRLGQRVAEHFGSPQDIEWSLVGDDFRLLQSRPITTLYPVPESLLEAKHLRVLFSLNSLQGVVEPFTPLGRDTLIWAFGGLVRAAGVRSPVQDVVIAAGGRLYVDVTALLSDRRLRRVAMGFLSNADPGAREAARGLVESGRIQVRAAVGLRDILRLIAGFPSVWVGIVMTWLRPEAMRKRAMSKADRYVALVRRATFDAISPEAHIASIDRLAHDLLLRVFKTIAPVMAPGMMAIGIVGNWLTEWGGLAPGTVRQLLRGVPGNPTTEMDLRLWTAAQAIQSDPDSAAVLRGQPAEAIVAAYQSGELPHAAQQAIKAFIAEYGMRGSARSTWVDPVGARTRGQSSRV